MRGVACCPFSYIYLVRLLTPLINLFAMKKLLLLLTLAPFIAFGQTTLIPDANFEQALIDLGYDTGTPDGSVLTANINTVSQLFILAKSITDLTGIEDFAALTSLFCASNQLTSLDVSQNAALINLDFSYNQVISLDVSQNAAIEGLTCNSNQLTILDVSQNPALEFLACKDNQLSCLNVKNGNNTNMGSMGADGNPNLFCIEVDDTAWADTNWTVAAWNIDSIASFSNNCGNPCAPCHSLSTIAANACDSYSAPDSQVYTESGQYTAVFTNVNGCDSTIFINLKINSSSNNISENACDSFLFENTTYTSSGTYVHNLTSVFGCDSIVSLNLTINNSSSSSSLETACNSYTWNGITYTSSGTYTYLTTNATGCDSTASLNLTIDTLTVSVTTNGTTLTAQPAGGSYQWLDCDNAHVPVSGETSQDYTPTTSGNYAVVIILGACTDTTDCQAVTIAGVSENPRKTIGAYPNPTTGILTIEGAEGTVTVYDIYGRLVLTTNSNVLDISQAAMGIYFVHVLDEQGKVYSQKVVKY